MARIDIYSVHLWADRNIVYKFLADPLALKHLIILKQVYSV